MSVINENSSGFVTEIVVVICIKKWQRCVFLSFVGQTEEVTQTRCKCIAGQIVVASANFMCLHKSPHSAQFYTKTPSDLACCVSGLLMFKSVVV